MKLTIHELEYPELVTSRIIYKYIIELNNFVITSVVFENKLTKEEFVQKTFSLLYKELLKDSNITNRFVFDWSYITPDIKHTKYEYKLEDTYIKDLLLRKKMEAIERDFT